MVSKNNPKGRGNELVVQDLKDEVLIYDLAINKAYCLNQTAAMIWNLCDGNNSVADITRQLSKSLNQPITDDLVWLALDQFREDNLLSDNAKAEIRFNGLSRREVIRKAGLASMIALPVITSLMAPTSAMAQSNCTAAVNKPNGCPIGTPVSTGSQTCGISSDAARSSICDAFFGPQCSSTNAVYAVGSCVQIGPDTQYNCICAA